MYAGLQLNQANFNRFASGGGGSAVEYVVTTLAALKALTSRPAAVRNKYRSTAGDLGGGVWTFQTGNQSANVTADPQSGLWAAPDSDPTGASGAWQRESVVMAFPPWFGGRGFTTNAGVGSTDATAGVLAAHQSGYPVDGGGLWYGITGSMRPLTNFAKFVICLRGKQLAPTTSNCRTLFYDEVPGLYLRDIIVDCGGDQDAGDMSNFAGVWISGSTTINWKAIDVEVHNGGPICGIRLNSVSKGQLVRPVVRDFTYNLSPDPTDDVIQGIFANACTNVEISNAQVHDLTGFLSSVASLRYTRGIAIAGGTDINISAPNIYNCDQLIDCTGSAGNVRVHISNVTLGESGTYAVKFSNAHQQCSVVGGTINKAGLAGVVITGQASATPIAIDWLVADLIISDTGSSGLWSASNPSGVLINASTNDNTYPRGGRIRNVGVIDTQGSPTTVWDFRNDSTPLDNYVDHTCWSRNCTNTNLGSSLAQNKLGYLAFTARGVNFNSGNTDTLIPITLPQGYSEYTILRVSISNASASLTTATCGVFSASGGGGTAIVASGTAITVSTASDNTNNNTQTLTVVNAGTLAWKLTTIYFRVQTPQGSAATGDVTVTLEPRS